MRWECIPAKSTIGRATPARWFCNPMKVRKWRAYFDGDQLHVRTPWFYIWLSAGGCDFAYDELWWGVEVGWSPDWSPPPGSYIFQNRWKHEMRRQRYV
jgi:hypothetical protein